MLFASKEKHVGKKHYLFLHKDFDWSKKLSQFRFNGQNFFFWLTPCFNNGIFGNGSIMYLYNELRCRNNPDYTCTTWYLYSCCNVNSWNRFYHSSSHLLKNTVI
jgi:hypothetical protein